MFFPDQDPELSTTAGRWHNPTMAPQSESVIVRVTVYREHKPQASFVALSPF